MLKMEISLTVIEEINIKYGNIKNGNQHKSWKYQTHFNTGKQEIIYLSGLALSKTKVP